MKILRRIITNQIYLLHLQLQTFILFTYGEMGKEKEKSEDRPLIRYEKLSKEDLVDYCRVYWRRIHNDEMLFNEIYKDIESLKSGVSVYKSQMNAYKKKYLSLLKANTELDEKVRFLEECLDRKEKLNEKYRKEIEKLKSTYVYDAKQVRDIC